MIALARFLQFISTMVLFGSSLFYLYGFKDPFPARWPRLLLAVAVPVAFFSLIAWIMLQAVSLSGNARDAIDAAFLWSMLSETGFGHVLLFRLAVAALAWAALLFLWKAKLRTLARSQALLGAVLVASFAGIGHAAGGEGSIGAWRITIDGLHLLSSAVWIGALVPLAILVSRAGAGGAEDGERAHYALVSFSGIGTAVVVILVHSALANSWFMVGQAPLSALYTTAYGVLLLSKVGLFLAMLVLAGANRFWLTPRLAAALVQGRQNARVAALLKLSVFTETGFAVLVLMAVGLMGTMEPPGM